MGRRRSYEAGDDQVGFLVATEVTEGGNIQVTGGGTATVLTREQFDDFLGGCRKEFFGGRTRQVVVTAPEIADSSKGRKAAKE
jgi:hypothetical protein